MVKYIVRSDFIEVNKIEVVKETECFVFIEVEYFGKKRTDRIAKRSDGTCVCDTYEEAKKFVVEFSENYVRSAEKHLEYCKGKLEKAKALTESEVLK